MNSPDPRRQKKIVIVLSAIVTILFVFAVLQQALNLTPYFSAPDRQTTLLLWALTSLNVILLAVCTLILLRNLLKLYFERRSHQLGSKFRTKLVIAFIGLSIIPVLFMALFAYSLLHRNLDKWFSTPIDQVVKNVEQIVQQINQDASMHATRSAKFLADHPMLRDAVSSKGPVDLVSIRDLAKEYEIPLMVLFNQSRVPICAVQNDRVFSPDQPEFRRLVDRLKLVSWNGSSAQVSKSLFERLIAPNESGPDKPEATLSTSDDDGQEMIMAGGVVQVGDSEPPGSLILGYKIQGDLLRLANEISDSREDYLSRSRNRKHIRNNFMLWLGLITTLILFAAVWIGLYLSKKISIPIRALAEAYNEVSKGNLLIQVHCPAEDEVGILVNSFNQMTSQLFESSQKLEQTNRDLQLSNQALEERRRYTEAVLENIPTGVVSIAPGQRITGLNKAAQLMLGENVSAVDRSLDSVFSPEDLIEIQSLIEKASRVGIASRDLQLHLRERQVYCAVTCSSLDIESASSQGFVMVLEDLTELLKAQKANAWREVARRMAHEIRNPLTPIQLSAERLMKNYSKHKGSDLLFATGMNGFETVLMDCVRTIDQEVATLKKMVDEFSRFARLPSARMVPTNLNSLIESTLSSYNGRLDGVLLETRLEPSLPEIRVDPEQFKRVIVNLIDNALEAMDLSGQRELMIESNFYRQRETVEIVVRDTGHGISPADKDRLFLPYFSTRKRGTGLGLAIVSRIIADHKGYIHVRDNVPTGASFVIEIPTG